MVNARRTIFLDLFEIESARRGIPGPQTFVPKANNLQLLLCGYVWPLGGPLVALAQLLHASLLARILFNQCCRFFVEMSGR